MLARAWARPPGALCGLSETFGPKSRALRRIPFTLTSRDSRRGPGV